MILLIGGESHSGKTLLAQHILEQCHVPYTSLDHLKMGLIRGWKDCPFTAMSPDAGITEGLWPIVKGMALTAMENGQNLILEGCYLPPGEVAELTRAHPGKVAACYLALSENYIRRNFETKILSRRCAIERRLYPEERTAADFCAGNRQVQMDCAAFGVRCFVIETDYESEIKQAMLWAVNQF